MDSCIVWTSCIFLCIFREGKSRRSGNHLASTRLSVDKLGRAAPRARALALHASAWLYYMVPPPPDIREEFKRRGSVTLLSTEAYDSRRMASFAPYFVVPFCFFVVNRAPSEHRIRAWTACLVAFGFCSVIMYNTDTSADGDGPVFVRAREVR